MSDENTVMMSSSLQGRVNMSVLTGNRQDIVGCSVEFHVPKDYGLAGLLRNMSVNADGSLSSFSMTVKIAELREFMGKFDSEVSHSNVLLSKSVSTDLISFNETGRFNLVVNEIINEIAIITFTK